MTNRSVEAVSVIIPACDEEGLLPGCLAALRRASSALEMRVRTIVVLDSCRDGTAEVCRNFGVEAVTVSARNVGVARSVGFDVALNGYDDAERLWLATTDADSVVGGNWLVDQVRMARRGSDAVLGVIRLTGDRSSQSLRCEHQSEYDKRLFADGSHSHVHGANLGIRGSAYLRAGGFPPLANHEDRGLLERLRRLPDARIDRCRWLVVETSSRLSGRCSDGVSADLARLSDGGSSRLSA